jgi:uncharacterized protein (TIGR03084 family)
VDLDGLIVELAEEQEALDQRVAGISDEAWATLTPAIGWTVQDQISHLSFFDRSACLALTDPGAFGAQAELVLAAVADAGVEPGANTPDVAEGRQMTPAEMLASWRGGRAELVARSLTVSEIDPKARISWFGPAMGVASFVSARLMETWAHGQDVADALGLPPVTSERLRHVCHIGVGARAYAFLVNEQADPGDPIRVEAVSPAGELWTWGPPDAPDRVTGPGLDLALVLTQRRHRDDTELVVEGSTAQRWIAIAQAFAGPAGPGRTPMAILRTDDD